MKVTSFAGVLVSLSLVFAACGKKEEMMMTIGGMCSMDGGGGCASGESCMGLAGGYCTKSCTTSGSMTECPSGAICATFSNPDGGAITTCLQSCTLQTDCRQDAGIQCNGVSGSSGKACRPN